MREHTTLGDDRRKDVEEKMKKMKDKSRVRSREGRDGNVDILPDRCNAVNVRCSTSQVFQASCRSLLCVMGLN